MERSNTSPVTVEQWAFINSIVIHKGRIHEVVDDPWFQMFQQLHKVWRKYWSNEMIDLSRNGMLWLQFNFLVWYTWCPNGIVQPSRTLQNPWFRSAALAWNYPKLIFHPQVIVELEKMKRKAKIKHVWFRCWSSITENILTFVGFFNSSSPKDSSKTSR